MELENYTIRKANIDDCAAILKLIQVIHFSAIAVHLYCQLTYNALRIFDKIITLDKVIILFFRSSLLTKKCRMALNWMLMVKG